MVATAADAGRPMHDVVVLERSGRSRASRGAPHPVGPPAAAVGGGHQLCAAVCAARAQADRGCAMVHLRAQAGARSTPAGCAHFFPSNHAVLSVASTYAHMAAELSIWVHLIICT